MTSDFWIIFQGGGEALILGTPRGRQFAGGSSPECEPSARSSTSALAQGINGTSPGLRSAAMSRMYLAPPDSQTPDRSGWPSGDRGAGAERLGLPQAPSEFCRSGLSPTGHKQAHKSVPEWLRKTKFLIHFRS